MKKVSIILPYYNRLDHLVTTLESFEYFYQNKNLEIVIVDDGSDENNRLEHIVITYDLNIRLIRLENKNGINPCYPYNVGVRESSGDIIILSSPETFHTSDMFTTTNNFEKLNDNTYLILSVFCLTNKNILEDTVSNSFIYKLRTVDGAKPNFYNNLGELGYPYNNKFGSWYSHSEIRPSNLNFFSILTRNKYYEISGFDERFRNGTGFDDDDFRDRLIESGVEFIPYDDAVAIHMDHEVVNNANPVTNAELYSFVKNNKYKKNDLWGRK